MDILTAAYWYRIGIFTIAIIIGTHVVAVVSARVRGIPISRRQQQLHLFILIFLHPFIVGSYATMAVALTLFFLGALLVTWAAYDENQVLEKRRRQPKTLFEILEEPQEKTYDQLLRTFMPPSSWTMRTRSLFEIPCVALVAVPETSRLSVDGQRFLRGVESRSEPQRGVGMHVYRLDDVFVGHALGLTKRLYAWKSLECPADLCIYARDGDPILVTISAERRGYLVMTDEEAVLMVGLVPTLKFAGRGAIENFQPAITAMPPS